MTGRSRPARPRQAAAPALGLRARHKRDKLQRIQRAAWTLFRKRGFEATTTREVARVAGVATGTIFLYARDKADLLLLAFQDAIVATTEAAFASLPRRASLTSELAHVFGRFFELYRQDLALARVFIKEVMVPGDGQRQRMGDATAGFLQRVAGRVAAAQAAGRVAEDVDPVAAAANCFALYYGVLAGWLGGWLPPGETPEAVMRAALELQWRGLVAPAERQQRISPLEAPRPGRPRRSDI
jgi:AcrR family transcriptional regulator